MTAGRQPRSARLLVHDGRGHRPTVVVPGRPDADLRPPMLPGMGRRTGGSLYAVSRYGSAQRRAESASGVRRRLWALWLLIGAWIVLIAITLQVVLDLGGWQFAIGTHLPMLGLLVALIGMARTERRWLRRLRAGDQPPH